MIRTRLAHRLRLSPNVEPRPPGVWPSILLLHYTGMESAEAACRWLCSPQSRVSSHYLIDETGEIIQMVGEDMRAWHAGDSCWAGETDINSHSIGIEIHNRGHSLGYDGFPEAQMQTVVALSQDIVARNAIRPECVLGHSDVAPHRKIDPGEKFDWHRMHAAGVGRWTVPIPIAGKSEISGGAAELQQKLRLFGYCIDISGQYDKRTRSVLKAFQRHFRPQCVDGIADVSTTGTLDRLIGN